jgi:DNA replication regulator DPB11
VNEPVVQRGPFVEGEDYSKEDNDPPTADIRISSLEVDDADIAPPDLPTVPAPLHELSQERVNSPKKRSQRHRDDRESSPEKQDPQSALSTVKPSDSAVPDTHLNDSIAALLAQKQRASRAPSNPPSDNLSRRKRGLLGRASSGSSLTPVSRSTSIAPGPSQVLQPDGENDTIAPPQPSQRIIYEDESAWEERARIIKRMGGQASVEPPLNSVRSIGVVKDVGSAADGSVAQRTKRRGR